MTYLGLPGNYVLNYTITYTSPTALVPNDGMIISTPHNFVYIIVPNPSPILTDTTTLNATFDYQIIGMSSNIQLSTNTPVCHKFYPSPLKITASTYAEVGRSVSVSSNIHFETSYPSLWSFTEYNDGINSIIAWDLPTVQFIVKYPNGLSVGEIVTIQYTMTFLSGPWTTSSAYACTAPAEFMHTMKFLPSIPGALYVQAYPGPVTFPVAGFIPYNRFNSLLLT